jgi:metalloendopeptidase OMA1, mitochondrial
MKMRPLLLKIATIMILAAATACSPHMRFEPGKIPAATVPPQQVKTEAEHFVKAHIDDSNFKRITSGKQLARLTNVVNKLTVAAGYPIKTFPLHLVDGGDLVNAAAFNGASIVVYKALLDKVTSDDELATVLGHEIGHIIATHYKDAEEEQERGAAVAIGSSLLGVVAEVATSAAGYSGASDLAGTMAETATSTIGYGAFVGSFSRTQEYEADHIGLIIMSRAGYDPKVAVKFWKRSKEVFGSSESSSAAFFSTHPASNDRADELEKALPIALAQKLPEVAQSLRQK